VLALNCGPFPQPKLLGFVGTRISPPPQQARPVSHVLPAWITSGWPTWV